MQVLTTKLLSEPENAIMLCGHLAMKYIQLWANTTVPRIYCTTQINLLKFSSPAVKLLHNSVKTIAGDLFQCEHKGVCEKLLAIKFILLKAQLVNILLKNWQSYLILGIIKGTEW